MRHARTCDVHVAVLRAAQQSRRGKGTETDQNCIVHDYISTLGQHREVRSGTHAKGLEEPLVLPARVPVLQQLLNLLLRVLPLRNLLERF